MQRFWDTITEPLLNAVKPEGILEIGSDEGLNTRKLLSFCEPNGATLHVIDPLPKYDVNEWQKRHGGRLVFHHALSLEAIPQVEGFDVALIDGDHNWYTVFNELKLIENRCEELSKPFPLVMFHDIVWPYGRRDLYYDPENIPKAYRQPHERKGMQIGASELLDEGGLNAHLHNATHEGGPRNGVLTAVEDFIRDTDHALDLLIIPVLNGLGILTPLRLKEQNEELARLLDTLSVFQDDTSLTAGIATLVENERLAAQIQRKEAETQRREARLENRELTKRLEREREKSRSLASSIEELERLFSALLASRQWKIGRAFGELNRRLMRRPRRPTAASQIVETFRQIHARKRGANKPPPRAPDPRASVRPSPGNPLLRLKRRIKRFKPRIPRGLLAKKIRARLGTPPERDEWPQVSIVILNRNDLAPLKKLLSGLRDHTNYPNFEVVLVDGDSTDGSVEFAKSFDAPFEVRLVEIRRNMKFSTGCNQGAEAAAGDLLLFLDNGIEPFEPGWLREMVHLVMDSSADMVGARLLGAGPSDTPSGYAVRHRKIGFDAGRDFPRAFDVGIGEDALDEHLGTDGTCPAATAACLMVERKAFEAVGGFESGYKNGMEDVDLGLKLTLSGREAISSGRAVLLHNERDTRNNLKHLEEKNNRLLFAERWGARLERSFLLERLGDFGFWSEDSAHIAIAINGKARRDSYDNRHTARELGEALEKHGMRISYVEQKSGAWYSLPEDVDYLVVQSHAYDITRVSGVKTIAWIHDSTEAWIDTPWFERFDTILTSSRASKAMVESKTGKIAHLFLAATNPKWFHAVAPEPAYESDYVFVGDHTGPRRVLLINLGVLPDEKFMVFGKDWEKAPRLSRHTYGHLSYDELPKAFSSSKILVDDGGASTLPGGSVNPHVLDALAAGALVIANREAGVHDFFDEEFPTFSTVQELREQLDRLLGDDEKRTELVERYRKKILDEYTYDHRAGQLVEILRQRANALSFCIKMGAPDWEVAHRWGDLHFARAMQKQLEQRGHPCRIQPLDEWEDFEGLRRDVTIHLKGLKPYTPKPGQLNVLWNISHPDILTPRECDKYDFVFVASERWANRLHEKTNTPVAVLEQATDPEVFFPDYDQFHKREIVFVGNSRQFVPRKILPDLLPTSRDLAVWGKNWEKYIDARYIAGEHLPNNEVRKAYSSAAIVLNDHWDDMQEYGFVSNRVYDVLACGAFLISDDMPELRERFGDAVVTYQTPEELRDLIEHYLASPEERAEKGEKGRKLVLEKYTFYERIDRILEEIMQLLPKNTLLNTSSNTQSG